MLKIIKYDLKSVGIITGVMTVATLIINIAFWSLTANSIITKASDYIIDGLMVNVFCYVVFVAFAIGNMWRKMNSDTELYEMAGISPLKVGATRMLIVFISVTIYAILLMLGETILHRIYLARLAEIPQSDIFAIISTTTEIRRNSMFSISGMQWTNIFTPIFAGLYASILFTTSFLFVTANRRFNHAFASAVLLGGIVILVLILNFTVLNKINIYLPELNLNKLPVSSLIIERFGNHYGDNYVSFLYVLNPNMLNVGLLLYQSLYVALMFAIYSVRRKAI